MLDIVYDGDCPFCSRYADLVALRSHGLDVRLHNARSVATRALFPEAWNYDLDDGMLVRWQDGWHYGAEAVSLISRLVGKAPLAGVLARGGAARLLYPLLRAGRNAALRAWGRPGIMKDN